MTTHTEQSSTEEGAISVPIGLPPGLRGLVLPAAILLVPAPLWAADEGGAGLFSVNLGLSIWTLVVFLLVVWILGKFAWGPILGALDSREAGIRGALDEAAEARVEARKMLEEHKAQLADARRQSQEIVAEAREAGQTVRKEIQEQARTEADALLARAQRQIARDRDEALATLRRESVDLALAAAGRLIHERLDDESDRALVERYLKDLESADPAASAGSGAA